MLEDLRQAPPEGCISDLEFDEWRALELAEHDAARLEQHVKECARCRRRHRQLEAEAAHFLEQYPRFEPSSTRELHASAWEKKTKLAGPRRRRVWALSSAGVALAAAAAVLVVLRPAAMDQRALPDVRSKGGAHVGFFVKRGPRVVVGHDDQVVYPGDRLRFTLSTRSPRHVAILGLDTAKVATIYHPSGSKSERVDAVSAHALDSSVELDSTLGEERIWGVFCPASFEVEPLRRQLEKTGKLTAPAGCTVDLLHLNKEAAP